MRTARSGGHVRWRLTASYLLIVVSVCLLLATWFRNHHHTSSTISLLLHEQEPHAREQLQTLSDAQMKAIDAGVQHAAELVAAAELKRRQQQQQHELAKRQGRDRNVTDSELEDQQQQQQQQQQQLSSVSSTPAPSPSVSVKAPLTVEEATAQPVLVQIMTAHFFGDGYSRTVPDCTYQGRPITCIWGKSEDPSKADALWYHGCQLPGTVVKLRPEQLTIGMYMESSQYYPCLEDLALMDKYDLEMTYRLCSHAITHYFDFTHETVRTKLFAKPKAFEEKKDAVAYVNSNCQTVSGRDAMISALMETGKIPVHSYGQCLRNMENHTRTFNKVELFSSYKFCVAIENSITKDYMTEKLWNAFVAGCVPIYLGPPNIKDFLPDDNAIVLWSDFSNANAVADELVRLMNNKTAYEEKLRWKHVKKISDLNLGLRQLMGTDVAPKFHSQCQICQIIVGNRMSPRNFTGTHCMRNQTWLQSKTTSWTPAAVGYARITDSIDFRLPG